MPMSTRTDFTADEWKLLLEGVLMAGIAVTAADPSGIWGTLKEGVSTASALDAGRSAGNPLITALIADLETSAGRDTLREGLKQKLSGLSSSGAPQMKVIAVDALREVAALLDSKAPGDSAAVKSWLHQISHRAAEASKEGGLLGFGGVKVSDAEKATLAEIDDALGSPGAAL
jgi:hypothetical protein